MSLSKSNFISFVPTVHDTSYLKLKITRARFNQWKRTYLFDAVKNIDYGHSFCAAFRITDYILLTTKNIEQCDKHIKKFYIRK